jgi:hypothetical protein
MKESVLIIPERLKKELEDEYNKKLIEEPVFVRKYCSLFESEITGSEICNNKFIIDDN